MAPILLPPRAAATTDLEMGRLQAELEAERLKRMTHNVRSSPAPVTFAPGITLRYAADALWTYSAPELYAFCDEDGRSSASANSSRTA